MHTSTFSFSRSVATRVAVTGCLALLVVLAAVTASMSWVATQHARAQVVELMLDRTDGVAHALDAIDLTSRTMVERTYPVFAAMVGAELRHDGDSGLLSNAIPLEGNFTAVDRFQAETGGVATIFAKSAKGFKRIATSVRQQDGSRALGTVLDPAGAAYAAVSKGAAFSGRAVLFGKAYMTHYRPVADTSGQIIAVLFIGFEIGSFDAAVEEIVARSRFFESGGVYLIDPRGNAEDAVFISHPTAKGKKVVAFDPEAAPFLRSLADAKTEAVSSPGLLSKTGQDRFAVVRKTADSGVWVVAEVSDREAMATHWRTLVPFWGMLALACLALGMGLLWMTTRWVGRPLRALSEAATAVAQGDLSRSHASDRQDEIGQVVEAVEAMRVSFVEMLLTVRQSADSIATASSQIASGNQDLSGRTEQAAANLQQTASSMEQFTGSVRHTAESAHRANDLASLASASACRGGATMTQMVDTMRAIEHSARQISEISSVIDGIAFQTNILALNAAVEAARAGEQGRGFAVVATEVRTLAQRSATAAREIKALIGASVEKVEAGSQLVKNAGAAMNDIVDNVKRVDDIIAGISTAAAEQSDGILQINSAVSDLDQMTQQNSALVEESAAAAQSLQEQAIKLSSFMQRFNTPRSDRSMASGTAA